MNAKKRWSVAASTIAVVLWIACGTSTPPPPPGSAPGDAGESSSPSDAPTSDDLDAGASDGGGQEPDAGIGDAGYIDAGIYRVTGGSVFFINNGYPEGYNSDAGNDVAGEYRRNVFAETDRLEVRAHESDAFSADGITLDIRIKNGAPTACFLVGFYAPVSLLGDCEVQFAASEPAAGGVSGTFSGKMRQDPCCSTLYPEYMELDGGSFQIDLVPE